MEDKGERSHQTFLGNNFSSFNRDENKTIGALSSVSFAEYRSGIKATAWKTKMVMYSISSKMNSSFSTIGEATADKITATRLGKNSCFRFRVNN